MPKEPIRIKNPFVGLTKKNQKLFSIGIFFLCSQDLIPDQVICSRSKIISFLCFSDGSRVSRVKIVLKHVENKWLEARKQLVTVHTHIKLSTSFYLFILFWISVALCNLYSCERNVEWLAKLCWLDNDLHWRWYGPFVEVVLEREFQEKLKTAFH